MVTGAVIGVIAVALFATALGDASVAAIIAGVFTIVNTILNTLQIKQHKDLERGMRHTHQILQAPRRAIYDNEGRVIGTVLKLETDDWARVMPGPEPEAESE